MSKHFENLWEEAEKYHQEIINDTNHSSIFEEFILKLNLLKLVVENTLLPDDQKKKATQYAFGEILLTLTQLSLKDNINAYAALNSALHYKTIEQLGKKY